MRANIKLMGPKPNGDFVSFESHLTFSAVNSCSLWYSPKSSSLKINVRFLFVNIQQLATALTYLLELQLISLSTEIWDTLNTKSLFYPTCLRSILANVSTTRFATFENVHTKLKRANIKTWETCGDSSPSCQPSPHCVKVSWMLVSDLHKVTEMSWAQWMLETADTLSAPGFVHNNSESPILSSAAIFLSGATYQS